MSAEPVEERRGSQEPRLKLVPPSVDRVDGDDAVALAEAYRLVADPWQRNVVGDWMARRVDGKYAASRCGLAVPRQNGKNGALEIRELFGMVELGEKFLHTAHEVKTARKAFARLLSFFENDREYPELVALVLEVRKANGQEAIFLTNGGSVEFIARSKGSGRGFTVDVLVCDEAQELGDDALAALLPTISAAPLGNPQLILTGTPPSPSMNGEVFFRMREASIKGLDNRLCWKEWSCEADALDEWQANPALGDRLGWETVEDERAAMDPLTYARERCGVWDEIGGAGVLSLAAWEALTDPESVVEPQAFGVEVSLDRGQAAIGVAGHRPDGFVHVEHIEQRRGTGWLLARCLELAAQNPDVAFVIDGGGPANSLIEDLEAEHVRVVVAQTKDVGIACAGLIDAVNDSTLRHGPQPELDAAIKGAKKRPLGDGAFAFGRKASGVDISTLQAVTLAHWAATSHLADLAPVNNVW